MDANQIHKLWLQDFWSKLGGNKNLGYKAAQSKKLAELIRLSKVVIEYKHQQSREYRRKAFNCIKLARHDLKTHPKCFVCFNPATVRHHIILLKNGGINNKRNLVSLCNNCHAKIHLWL